MNVAAFPLQLLLRDHREWRTRPVAVVEDDRPQAPVLYVNARARRAGVRTGQRYATALAIDRQLRAGAVPPSQVDEQIRQLTDRLRRHSPRVEPSIDVPGVFWLDVAGFTRLHPSLDEWAKTVRADLRRLELWSSVAVGFSRFGVYALALAHRGVVVSAEEGEERTAVGQIPIGRLGMEPRVRDRLLALGVGTVGDFLRLPGGEIRVQFGAAIGALHALADGRRAAPLVPVPAAPIHERTVHFDTPEQQVERLVFVVKRLLDELMSALSHQGLTGAGLVLHLTLDDRTRRREPLRPAAPTLDVAQWLALVRLRLEALRLSSGIVTLHLVIDACPAAATAPRLFADQTRRDAAAASQALARLRAECGEQSVVRARLRDAHLPAARFAWEPIVSLPLRPSPRVVAARPLVRRIHAASILLAPGFGLQASGAAEVGGWKLGTIALHEPGAAEARSPRPGACSGPFLISGGWWLNDDRGVQREYYFVHTPQGELWWVYFDRRRQRFFLQGGVE